MKRLSKEANTEIKEKFSKAKYALELLMDTIQHYSILELDADWKDVTPKEMVDLIIKTTNNLEYGCYDDIQDIRYKRPVK